eukprot:2164662-Prymnesium_polylepis.1
MIPELLEAQLAVAIPIGQLEFRGVSAKDRSARLHHRRVQMLGYERPDRAIGQSPWAGSTSGPDYSRCYRFFGFRHDAQKVG